MICQHVYSLFRARCGLLRPRFYSFSQQGGATAQDDHRVQIERFSILHAIFLVLRLLVRERACKHEGALFLGSSFEAVGQVFQPFVRTMSTGLSRAA